MAVVSLKGNKYGLSVNISGAAPFERVKEETAKVFGNAGRLFGTEQIAIGFEGRMLSNAERDELVDIIKDNCSLNIVCVMDFNVGTEERFKRAVEKFSEPEEPVEEASVSNESPKDMDLSQEESILQNNEGPDVPEVSESAINMILGDENASAGAAVPEDISKIAKFYKGNVRSGVVLDEDSSLIILGDVSPGAEVISKGNIIVLGALRGNAFAGRDGNNQCFVVALNMNPLQVRIGDIIARSAESNLSASKEEHEPKIAIVNNNTIAIELIKRSVLDMINI